MPIGQKGIAHILILIVLAIGLIGGLYLIQNPTVFKPKASTPTGTAKFVLEIVSGEEIVGQELEVKLLANTASENANLFSAKITFSHQTLEVVREMSLDPSLNVVENFKDNITGQISLIGDIAAPGINTNGQNRQIGTITFRVKAAGNAQVNISPTSGIFKNSDSTDILSSTLSQGLTFNTTTAMGNPNIIEICKADINYDGQVDIHDLSKLSSCLGRDRNAGDCRPADINNDGVINGSSSNTATNTDYGYLQSVFGQSCTAHLPANCTVCRANIRTENPVVNIDDFSQLSNCFDQSPTGVCLSSDIDRDGSVNYGDFQCLSRHYSQTCPASNPPLPASVPFNEFVTSFGSIQGNANFRSTFDVNGDTRIDILDFSILSSNNRFTAGNAVFTAPYSFSGFLAAFGSTRGQSNFNELYDRDGDNDVDIHDFAIFSSGTSTAGNCTIQSVKWMVSGSEVSTATRGNLVTIQVTTSGTGTACSGKQVAFIIEQDNGVFGTGAATNQPAAMNIAAGGTAANWIAEFRDVGPFGFGNPPKYKATATLVGAGADQTRVTSGGGLSVNNSTAPINGDCNRNGQIDLADLSALRTHWGKNAANNDRFPLECDTHSSQNRIIDTFDYSTLIGILRAAGVLR